jgi:NAD(P)-dependent dehydrogenase (short-subunit alcohol dehydrogenase family)
MTMKKKLDGKWALVTGSSRGIGQQIAKGLARRRCNVIIHARQKGNLEKTINMLNKYDVETYSLEGDLSTFGGVEKVILGVKSGPGHIDILYNNAAITNKSKSIWEVSIPEWLETFQVNLFAVVALCNAFAPGMKLRGYGRIINLTSRIQDQPNLAAYSVSKSAVDKYTRELAVELEGSNVLVNYLDPGWIKTDLGGPYAWYDVDTVLPGALVPALLEDNGPTGRFFYSQDFKYLE